MAEVVLYHHVQGLTAGVVAFADELRRAGHTVHTPDLFEGHTFATIEDGMAFARAAGFEAVLERGVAAAEALPTHGVVYAGFSMGVMPAQKLAQTRAGTRGALLFHACMPVAEFGERWPDDVPVQVHGMDADPFFTEEGGDLDAARELVASTDVAELFLYPGKEHLFTDSSLPSYDPAATALLVERALRFLDDIAATPSEAQPG
ncbi:dienelactone hydrolase family protein [Nocardioides mesophilus]|uniref:Dienelactone hydrolase family protein n=1 Tax=Nocardioides mesophilus TaxID=433659 RepID=A0A7G9R8V4_9ACTN|nr:dienelactone hydrolase family protein [Nocardioides mesophilus]QNN52029.1 dienelactone hydrolase family protein [Nocardioides mesophilus]